MFFCTREVARLVRDGRIVFLKIFRHTPPLCHPERSESEVEPVGRCEASGSPLKYKITLFLKTKTRKTVTRSLRCYAPWFARLQLANFGYAQDDIQWQEKILSQVSLPPPLCKGRWHFRKKMTEGLFYLFGLCGCRVRAFLVSLVQRVILLPLWKKVAPKTFMKGFG